MPQLLPSSSNCHAEPDNQLKPDPIDLLDFVTTCYASDKNFVKGGKLEQQVKSSAIL
jgi:hypothetical protein